MTTTLRGSDNFDTSLSAWKLLSTQTTNGAANYDWTGIPSGAQELMLNLWIVTVGALTEWELRIGAGSFPSTGYTGNANYVNNAPNSCTGVASTSGLIIGNGVSSGMTLSGHVRLFHMGSNIWTYSGSLNRNGIAGNFSGGGTSVGAALNQLRLTTQAGSAFTGGTASLHYRG